MRALDPQTVTRFRRDLLRWFRRHGRDLPWRRTRDPYHVLVSEVMLQQTQVSRVQLFYGRFLDRWPTLHHLARAKAPQVRREWEGLGYYRRAANLHALAKVVVAEHGGTMPRGTEALRKLPGIGPYTRAAVLSIAYGAPLVVVDGNVVRVIARLFRLAGGARSPALQRKVRELGQSLLDPRQPGDFNQALMELGATVCTPRAPRCDACPLRRNCQALAAGEPLRWPRREPVTMSYSSIWISGNRWRTDTSHCLPPLVSAMLSRASALSRKR